MQRATLKDVAHRAEVHVATASRALNDATQHMVSPETLERVLGAAQELGYTTNMTARTLRTACSRAVGMLIPDLTNPIFPPMVRGVEEVLRGLGYSTWVMNTDDDVARSEEAVSAFRQRNVDGFILATARLHDPVVDRMREERFPTPFVLANRRADRPGVPSAGVVEADVVRLALDHLVGIGHRRIVLLAGPQDVSTGRATAEAFTAGVQDRGLPSFSAQVTECATYSVAAGREAMRHRLGDGAPFTAVLAGNDQIALGCLDVLAEAGLHCPRDVSVVGINDMLSMDRVTPALTTVRVPFEEIGSQAATLLGEAMRGSLRPEPSVLLTTSLIVRDSTAPPAGASVTGGTTEFPALPSGAGAVGVRAVGRWPAPPPGPPLPEWRSAGG